MRDVALVPEHHVLKSDNGIAAQHAGQPGHALAHDRILLVRHRRRALLAAGERLERLAHLRSLQVADLGREAVERRSGLGQGRQQPGVAIARDHLRGHLLGLKLQPSERERLDPRIRVRVGADGTGQLADGDARERFGQPPPLAPQLHGEAIGKPLALKFVRGGGTQEVSIVVGERPRGGE